MQSYNIQIVIKGMNQSSPAFRSLNSDFDQATRRIQGIGPDSLKAGQSIQGIGNSSRTAGQAVTASMGGASKSVQDFDSHLGRSRTAVGGFSTFAAGAFKAVAIGVGLAAVAVGAFAVKAVKAASDTAEAQNKVNVVFGGSAKVIDAFTKDAAKNLGLSRLAAQSAAGTFGNLFVAMKIGQPEAAEMSKGILTLASDLASFNNITVDEALEKLRAGLVGETEPLRTLGVNLTAVQVKAKALEMGFRPLNGEFSAAAKAQASYALILEQTTTAQGDFINTRSGMANALRIIGASFEDMSAAIGTKVLPLIAPLISNFAEALPGALDKAIGFIDTVKTRWGELRSAFEGKPIVGEISLGEGESGDIETKLSPIQEVLKGLGENAGKVRDAIITVKEVLEGKWEPSPEISAFHLLIGNTAKAINDDLIPALKDLQGENRNTEGSANSLNKEFGLQPDTFGNIITAISNVIRILGEWDQATRPVMVAIENVADAVGKAIKATFDWATEIRNSGGVFANLDRWLRNNVREYDLVRGAIDLVSRAYEKLEEIIDRVLGRQRAAPPVPAGPSVPRDGGESEDGASAPSAPRDRGEGEESFATLSGQFKVIPGMPNQPRMIMAHGGEVIGTPSPLERIRDSMGGEAIQPMSELRERVATVGFGDKQVVSPFDRAQQTIYEIVNSIVQASHTIGTAIGEQADQFLGRLGQTRFGGFIESVIGMVKSKDVLADEPIFDPSKAIRYWDETFSEFLHRHDLGHIVGSDNRIFEDEFYRTLDKLIAQSSGKVSSHQSLDPITGQHESVSKELSDKLFYSGSLFPTEVAARVLGGTSRPEDRPGDRPESKKEETSEETSKLGIREVFQNSLGEFWTRFGGSTQEPPAGFEFSHPEHFEVGIREAFQNVFGEFWTRPVGNSEEPPAGFDLAYPEAFATAVREVFKNALEEFWTRPVGSTQEPPEGYKFAYSESFQTLPGQFKIVPGMANQPRPIVAHGGEVLFRPEEPIVSKFALNKPISTISYGDQEVIAPVSKARTVVNEIVSTLVQASQTVGGALGSEAKSFLSEKGESSFLGVLIDSIVGLIRNQRKTLPTGESAVVTRSIFPATGNLVAQATPFKVIRYWEEPLSEFVLRHEIGHTVDMSGQRILSQEIPSSLKKLAEQSYAKVFSYEDLPHFQPTGEQQELVSKDLQNQLFSTGQLSPSEIAAQLFALGIRPDAGGQRDSGEAAESAPDAQEGASTSGAIDRIREVFMNALGEFWTRIAGSTQQPPAGFQFVYPESFQTRRGEFKVVPGSENEPKPIMAHGGEVVFRPVALAGFNAPNEQGDKPSKDTRESVFSEKLVSAFASFHEVFRDVTKQIDRSSETNNNSERLKEFSKSAQSFQTEQGQWRDIPGMINQAVPIMAHGGEKIGREPFPQSAPVVNITAPLVSITNMTVASDIDREALIRDTEQAAMRGLNNALQQMIPTSHIVRTRVS